MPRLQKILTRDAELSGLAETQAYPQIQPCERGDATCPQAAGIRCSCVQFQIARQVGEGPDLDTMLWAAAGNVGFGDVVTRWREPHANAEQRVPRGQPQAVERRPLGGYLAPVTARMRLVIVDQRDYKMRRRSQNEERRQGLSGLQVPVMI